MCRVMCVAVFVELFEYPEIDFPDNQLNTIQSIDYHYQKKPTNTGM